jgi:hypothetical protein
MKCADQNAHWNGIVGRYLGQFKGLKSLCLGQVGVGENKMKFYRIQKKKNFNWASEDHAGGIKNVFTFGILSKREIR